MFQPLQSCITTNSKHLFWLRVIVFPGCDTHRRLLKPDLGTGGGGGGGGDLPILILRRHGAGETCAGHLQLVQRVSLIWDKNEDWRS